MIEGTLVDIFMQDWAWLLASGEATIFFSVIKFLIFLISETFIW